MLNPSSSAASRCVITFFLAFFNVTSRSRSACVISSCPSCIPTAWGCQEDISTLLKGDIITLPPQTRPEHSSAPDGPQQAGRFHFRQASLDAVIRPEGGIERQAATAIQAGTYYEQARRVLFPLSLLDGLGILALFPQHTQSVFEQNGFHALAGRRRGGIRAILLERLRGKLQALIEPRTGRCLGHVPYAPQKEPPGNIGMAPGGFHLLAGNARLRREGRPEQDQIEHGIRVAALEPGADLAVASHPKRAKTPRGGRRL